ncbi:hypothetical protein [Candidatus Villigracilis affinis]
MEAPPASIHDLLIQGNNLHDLKLGNSEAMVLNGMLKFSPLQITP